MRLSQFMAEKGLDDEAFADLSGGAFSVFAVKKWRYGERTPRPTLLRVIHDITDGKVTPNDFLEDVRESAE